jgi:integrase
VGRLALLVLIPGERHRETVVTAREQGLYLDHAPEPLKAIATILVETVIRPQECYRLRWEDLHWSSFGKSTLRVTKGKTPAARRVIPMSEAGSGPQIQRLATSVIPPSRKSMR